MCPFHNADFDRCSVPGGMTLFLHDTSKFKTTTVDILIPRGLQRPHNTKIALAARLLERGSRKWPDMQSLSRHMDHLFGASLSVEVEQMGDLQVLHASIEVLDQQFVDYDGRLLSEGLDFLHDVMHHPAGDGSAFREEYVLQEKRGLKRTIRALFNDKMAFAQRRCVEMMCPDEAYGLSSRGDIEDLETIDPVGLLTFYRDFLIETPPYVFITGNVYLQAAADLFLDVFAKRGSAPLPPAETEATERTPRKDFPREPRIASEVQNLTQGKLVQGYRCSYTIRDDEYAALATFCDLFGGDTHSRLFRNVREAAGLCYAIETRLESSCGFLFVDAGIDAADYEAVRTKVEEQLDSLRQGAGDEELSRVRGLLIKRLESMPDSRDLLVQFALQQELFGGRRDRLTLIDHLAEVSAGDVSRIAQGVQLDAEFFLH